MAATRSHSHFVLSHEALLSRSPSPPSTDGTNSPQRGQPASHDMDEIQRKRQHRHSKRLSLNFPIIIPARGSDTPDSLYTASPTNQTSQTMPYGTVFSPPSTYASNSAITPSISMPMPLTPPSEEGSMLPPSRTQHKNKGHGKQESTSAEFLTMLASQERRVLELKEELARAESDLTTLKRQWALYEAGKKKTETKGVPVKMGPVNGSHGRAASIAEVSTGLGLLGVEEPDNEEKLEAERERKREIIRDRMMGRVPPSDVGQAADGNGKKAGQRVFSSSRHTRTLSLLTSTTGSKVERASSLDNDADGARLSEPTNQLPTDDISSTVSSALPGLTRTNSGFEGLNLGKTYKDLANVSKRNLPPGLSPEQFVKHGKQVVDGVRDGFWTFFEDIRQATVGEDAITGANGGIRRQNSTKSRSVDGPAKLRRTATDASDHSTPNERNEKANGDEPSFWKEFGVDTPKSDKNIAADTADNRGQSRSKNQNSGRSPKGSNGNSARQKNSAKAESKPTARSVSSLISPRKIKKPSAEHHESKSSTDSRHPPSLVMSDLLDNDNDDDDDDEDEDEHEESECWDTWDSHTDSGSPRSARKRATAVMPELIGDADGKKTKSNPNEREPMQWHDLMS